MRAIVLLTVLLVTTTGVACTGAGSDDAPEGRIAFAIELDGDWRLVTVDADARGDLIVLRNPRDWPVIDATWSPGGTKIAYNDFEGFSVMNADGTEVRQVVENASGPLINFAWSPTASR